MFVGLRACKSGKVWGNNANIVHFNLSWVEYVSEKDMEIKTHDGQIWRIDSESLDIFLAAAYADEAK